MISFARRLIWTLALLILVGCAARAPESAPVASEAAYDREIAPAAAPQMDMDSQVAQATNGITSASLPDTRRVITTGQVELVVEDAGAAADAITSLVTELGGYISATNLYQSSYGSGQALRGSITLRIPAEELDRMLDELEAMAVEVRSESLNRQDVTDQFADLQAQLRALTATENELLELLAEVRAKPNATADEIMAVYQRITEIRTEIERIQGRLNLMDNQVRLSTLEVVLIPDVVSKPLVQVGWQPGAEARAALRALVGSVQNLADLLIWAVLFLLPILILLLIPVVIAGLVVRWIYRRFVPKRTTRTVPTPTDGAGG